MSKVEFSIEVKGIDRLESLIEQHKKLINQLDVNTKDIERVRLEISGTINQPLEGTDS